MWSKHSTDDPPLLACSLRALPRGLGTESLSQLNVVQFHSSTVGRRLLRHVRLRPPWWSQPPLHARTDAAAAARLAPLPRRAVGQRLLKIARVPPRARPLRPARLALTRSTQPARLGRVGLQLRGVGLQLGCAGLQPGCVGSQPGCTGAATWKCGVAAWVGLQPGCVGLQHARADCAPPPVRADPSNHR